MTGLMLLPDCVLPGCRQPVVSTGQPCDGCRAAFGDMLAPTTGPALTAELIRDRDQAVEHTYERRGFP